MEVLIEMDMFQGGVQVIDKSRMVSWSTALVIISVRSFLCRIRSLNQSKIFPIKFGFGRLLDKMTKHLDNSDL